MSKLSPTEDAAAPDAGQPTGFAHTARRITGWTSNFLASAIVVVAALTLGRHFVSLEEDDPLPQIAPQKTSPWQEGASFLRLGDGRYALTRHLVEGDQEDAREACRSLCRSAVQSAGDLPAEVDDYERRLLERVKSMDPLEESEGWTIHQMPEGAFPLLIATRGTANPSAAAGQNVVPATRRMVAWTMAVPAPQSRWNVYVFRNGQERAAAAEGLDIPPPPPAARTVTLRAEDGSGQIGFRGGPSPAEVCKFYDRWMAQHQFKRAGEWHARRDLWQARFLQAGERPVRVDVQFGPDARGETSGLITISPSTPAERTGS